MYGWPLGNEGLLLRRALTDPGRRKAPRPAAGTTGRDLTPAPAENGANAQTNSYKKRAPILYFLLRGVRERFGMRGEVAALSLRHRIFIEESHIGLRGALRGRGARQSDQSQSNEHRRDRRPMHEAPRQSSADGNRSERIRCGSGLELRHQSFRAVLGGVLGLVHHLVLGLAHVGPQVVLEL
jgi:hypothetical protein